MFNPSITDKEVQQFIAANLQKNLPEIILKGSPFTNISIQELANQIRNKKKAINKLPTWFSERNIYYPTKISIEQSSSEVTANYKSSLVFGKSLIDITGGFGVDSFYFSKHFKKVIHCEIDKELSKIVNHNFKQFNKKNIFTFSGDGILFLKESNELFDCIYIDPSRRDNIKRKVFLLNDCLPNILENLAFLFTKTHQILIKCSPILDLTSTINELKFVKEIHIVAVNNEVKELLFLLEKGYQSSIKIKTINYKKKTIQKFEFIYLEDVKSSYSLPLIYLYEPNTAILKSGGFHQVSTQFKLQKLQQHTHLYTSKKLIDFPGRRFKIKHILNAYDKKKIKLLLPENKANITIRNFPKTVAKIRKETNIKEGGNNYLFFTTNHLQKQIVIFCEQLF